MKPWKSLMDWIEAPSDRERLTQAARDKAQLLASGIHAVRTEDFPETAAEDIAQAMEDYFWTVENMLPPSMAPALEWMVCSVATDNEEASRLWKYVALALNGDQKAPKMVTAICAECRHTLSVPVLAEARMIALQLSDGGEELYDAEELVERAKSRRFW